MKNWPYIVLTILSVVPVTAVAREPVSTAVFPFGFVDTSPQAERPDEEARLATLNSSLRDALTKSGCCTIADLTPVAKQAQGLDMPSCNGCEVALAHKVGASISVTGWVQKVSNLILNINVVARDVSTGKVISAGSVDLRGNTDESWSRGLSYLLQNRLHSSDW